MGSQENDAADRETLAVQRLGDFLRRLPYIVGSFDDAYIEALARAMYADAASTSETGAQPDETGLHERVQRLVSEARAFAPGVQAVMFGMGDLLDSSLGAARRLALAEMPAQLARHPGIRLAINQIREKFGENLTTRKLAQVAGLSKSQFMAAFKRETGFTPHEYLRRVRISAGLRLLQMGKNVTETCFEVGFTSLSGFKEAFVELVGVLPSELSENPIPPKQ